MGLNEGLYFIRDNVLSLDPLPLINRVCFVGCQVGHKRLAQNVVTSSLDFSVMVVNRMVDKYADASKNTLKKGLKKIKGIHEMQLLSLKGTFDVDGRVFHASWSS